MKNRIIKGMPAWANIYVHASVLVCILFLSISCEKISEQPPVNEGYDNSFVMPEAEVLDAGDRAVITAMEEEYDENYNKQ